MASSIAYQGSLFDGGPSTPDDSFTGLRRFDLDERSWVEYCPGWLHGSDELFAELVETGRFSQRTVHMYDATVPEPRLTAGWSTAVSEDGPDAVPAALRAVSESVSRRYGVQFDRVWVNLYRDGRDSVAWHGDRNRNTHRNPLVVTVSIGARRRFLLRPRGGRTALELQPGAGDLVVMGGACQHEWEHTVPKQARAAGPRMSITLRHTAHLDAPGTSGEPLPTYWAPPPEA
ncbi:alpha-ketoglutarate-dependent dioxygenase AlkB [Motilibacter aurantiacus]|uniref:alpha-ketoglutarate-dependent dioxygenase AlkB n=1 Tax=Motilibacter aurantiacus TaxID=2714955 RepID=UPI00140AC19F|nr:alpha-ketoglutarate-dependent dioxygenase AlkB [Motilibacter aurantiacus]